MPKHKTNKSAAKRFWLTGGKKVKRTRAFKKHILTKKTRNRKRGLRARAYVHLTQERTIKKIIDN